MQALDSHLTCLRAPPEPGEKLAESPVPSGSMSILFLPTLPGSMDDVELIVLKCSRNAIANVY